jgi:hypothetical protein
LPRGGRICSRLRDEVKTQKERSKMKFVQNNDHHRASSLPPPQQIQIPTLPPSLSSPQLLPLPQFPSPPSPSPQKPDPRKYEKRLPDLKSEQILGDKTSLTLDAKYTVTPLMHVVVEGNTECVLSLLLSNSQSFEPLMEKRYTALDMAIYLLQYTKKQAKKNGPNQQVKINSYQNISDLLVRFGHKSQTAIGKLSLKSASLKENPFWLKIALSRKSYPAERLYETYPQWPETARRYLLSYLTFLQDDFAQHLFTQSRITHDAIAFADKRAILSVLKSIVEHGLPINLQIFLSRLDEKFPRNVAYFLNLPLSDKQNILMLVLENDPSAPDVQEKFELLVKAGADPFLKVGKLSACGLAVQAYGIECFMKLMQKHRDLYKNIDKHPEVIKWRKVFSKQDAIEFLANSDLGVDAELS